MLQPAVSEAARETVAVQPDKTIPLPPEAYLSKEAPPGSSDSRHSAVKAPTSTLALVPSVMA